MFWFVCFPFGFFFFFICIIFIIYLLLNLWLNLGLQNNALLKIFISWRNFLRFCNYLFWLDLNLICRLRSLLFLFLLFTFSFFLLLFFNCLLIFWITISYFIRRMLANVVKVIFIIINLSRSFFISIPTVFTLANEATIEITRLTFITSKCWSSMSL